MLFIFSLRINLIFNQKLYKVNLREKFNKNHLYLNDIINNKIIIYSKRYKIYFIKGFY